MAVKRGELPILPLETNAFASPNNPASPPLSLNEIPLTTWARSWIVNLGPAPPVSGRRIPLVLCES